MIDPSLPPHMRPDRSFQGLILTLQDVTYLRDQERRRENLVATLSHELRTPITPLLLQVQGFLERLRRQPRLTQL